MLDGQNMRQGISRDLSFTADDRSENLRRSAEVARLMNNAGLICVASFVAPSEAVRQKAADLVGRDRFFLNIQTCPLPLARKRQASPPERTREQLVNATLQKLGRRGVQ